MQTLNLNDDNPIKASKPFWRRQFQEEPTESQIRADWLFGVLLPVICFYFDPLVFSGETFGNGSMLGAYRPFAVTLSFVSIIAMAAWLLWREKLKGLAAVIAGLFLISGIVSLAIGVMLFPLSLLGLLFFLIGALGFTPLITGVVFLRNSVRAFRVAGAHLGRRVLIYTAVLSALYGLAFAIVLNAEVNRSLEIIAVGDAETIRSEGRKLRYVQPLVDVEKIVLRYRTNYDTRQTEEMAALAELYYELTGKDIKDSHPFTID